jgi:hypothetical protein
VFFGTTIFEAGRGLFYKKIKLDRSDFFAKGDTCIFLKSPDIIQKVARILKQLVWYILNKLG